MRYVQYSAGGRISDVLVASWPDGTTLWRTMLSRTGPDDLSIMFAFRGPYVDSDADDLAGVFYVNPEQVSVPGGANTEEIDSLASHGRWALDALGLQPASFSPVWGTFASEELDPCIAKLSFPSWLEARRAASSLDARMRRIWDAARPGGFDAAAPRTPVQQGFLKVAEEVGDAGFYGDAVDFVTGLLDPVIVRINGSELKNRGYLRVDAVRPTLRVQPMSFGHKIWAGSANLPGGWKKIGTLDTDRSKPHGYSFDGIVRHLMESRSIKVLSEPEYSQWFSEHTIPGELSLPAEELELYRALGEQIPFLWPAVQLSSWAVERWGGEP